MKNVWTLGLLALMAIGFSGCSTNSPSPPPPAPAPTNIPTSPQGISNNMSFAAVNQVFVNDCSRAGCHSQGSSLRVFANNEATVDSDKANILSQVTNGSMPPAGGMISASDKQLIMQYCAQGTATINPANSTVAPVGTAPGGSTYLPGTTSSQNTTPGFQPSSMPGSTTPSSSTGVSFAMVNSVLANNCGGGNCHGQGSFQTVYVDNEASVDADKGSINSWVSSGRMPRNRQMSDRDKQILLQYCAP